MKNILLIVMMGGYFTVSSQLIQRNEVDFDQIGLYRCNTKLFHLDDVISHAKYQTTLNVTYDNRYQKIDYPNGDVPENIGVCTDVVIRAFRFAGIDLQATIHESVKRNLKYYYPYSYKKGTAKADPNIDHRRVHILKKYLYLKFRSCLMTRGKNYLPGAIVFWDNWHVGIISDEKVPGTNRYYVIHNMGRGPVMEDVWYDTMKLEHFYLKLNER